MSAGCGTPDGLLAHRLTGSGEPVLLLNGGLMSYAAWEPVAQALARRYTVVGCDFRGQLLSPGRPPARIAGHARDVAALLDALGLPAAHVVGTSFGALVGLWLAAEQPQRVASLVAVTATAHVSAEMWRAAQPLVAAARAARRGGDPRAVFDALVPTTFSPAYRERGADALRQRREQFAALPPAWFEGLPGLVGALEGLDLRPQLGRIAAPALVIAAELDETFPVEHARALAAGLPNARLEVVAGVGHALVAEQPEALIALVRPFLASVAAAPAGAERRRP